MTDITITYAVIEQRVRDILKEDVLDTEAIRKLYREIEVYNAHKVIAGEDDRQMKDVEFLMRSAIFLMDLGKPGDWKCQMEAVLAVLATTHPQRV